MPSYRRYVSQGIACVRSFSLFPRGLQHETLLTSSAESLRRPKPDARSPTSTRPPTCRHRRHNVTAGWLFSCLNRHIQDGKLVEINRQDQSTARSDSGPRRPGLRVRAHGLSAGPRSARSTGLSACATPAFARNQLSSKVQSLPVSSQSCTCKHSADIGTHSANTWHISQRDSAVAYRECTLL